MFKNLNYLFTSWHSQDMFFSNWKSSQSPYR